MCNLVILRNEGSHSGIDKVCRLSLRSYLCDPSLRQDDKTMRKLLSDYLCGATCAILRSSG